MAIALALLLIALVSVLYHDRDFWFPDVQDADSVQGTSPVATSSAPQDAAPAATARKTARKAKPHLTTSAPAGPPPVVATATRTVLPPLEVEVVAGDSHQTLEPPTNAVKIDVQQDASGQETPDAPFGATETAEKITNNAAERVEMSADTADVLSTPVKPGYPMLARQMKVQGSVILLAMIGRDGLIQDLRILSGPPILATAAREAVKQWHFKPHYEGSQAVETVAKVTVNFTISTN
ncbi:MAG TPA: TonB family protein [Candidatus Acidoferrales bacterium]|nr:TonB family protein [Candidatus Acidoferrales bacterium]